MLLVVSVMMFMTIAHIFNYYKSMEALNIKIINKVKPKMPNTTILYDLSDFFKLMGDSTRIQLLWALEESEMCVGDLACLLNMTKSAVSHQLKILRSAKLVKAEKRGKNVFYSLSDHHVRTVLEMALEHVRE